MSDPSAARPRDYERDLGVIEAFTIIGEQCPNGSVRAVAAAALEAAAAAGRRGDPDALREQAFLVLSAIQGWRGERASQVHRSLSKFLDPAAGSTGPSSSR